MLKYNWTIDDLKNRYYKILKMRELEKDPKKLELIDLDIEALYSTIIDMEDPEKEDTPKLLENYQYAKREINKYKFLFEDIKEFHNLVGTPITPTPELKTISLSKKDILDLTHDFYKEALDKFFFHNFLKNYRKRFKHITFGSDLDKSDGMGETIHILSLKEAFIKVIRSYDIEDVLTTIHEYEHATTLAINPKHIVGANYTFCELDTLFMEMIASDYLENVFRNGEAALSMASRHEIHCCTADLLTTKFDLVKAEEFFYKDGYKSNKMLKESAKKYCKLSSEEVDDIIQQGSLSYDYSISYIFAVELYKMYKEDREKALNYLRKIVLLDCKSELEFYNTIKRFGIIPNLHMREFNREVNNSVLALTKK